MLKYLHAVAFGAIIFGVLLGVGVLHFFIHRWCHKRNSKRTIASATRNEDDPSTNIELQQHAHPPPEATASSEVSTSERAEDDTRPPSYSDEDTTNPPPPAYSGRDGPDRAPPSFFDVLREDVAALPLWRLMGIRDQDEPVRTPFHFGRLPNYPLSPQLREPIPVHSDEEESVAYSW